MKASILLTGSELTAGYVKDVNIFYLANLLRENDIELTKVIIVGDSEQSIKKSFISMYEENDLIIVTGGLGPTNDDITKEVIFSYLNEELIFNEKEYNQVFDFFKQKGRTISENNKKQFNFPNDCKILKNSIGTAHGIYYAKNEKHIILLPGVPSEIEAIADKHFESIFKTINPVSSTQQLILRLYGISESTLDKTITNEKMLAESLDWGTIANPEEGIKLRIILPKENSNYNEETIINRFKEKFGNKLYSYNNVTFYDIIYNLLSSKNMTLSVAESCTGGAVGKYITNNSGCSKIFKGGIIAYSNEIKNKVLNVDLKTLEKFGAVSQEVAEEMVLGCKHLLESDYAISITGIAGPTGGSKTKPVGTVWISVIDCHNVVTSKLFHFIGNRERIRTLSLSSALNQLRIVLENNLLKC